MPLLGEFAHRGGRLDERDARDEAIATMTALAPMTSIVGLRIPSGLAATIGRQGLNHVDLIRLKGFDYAQVATARTTDGVPAGISLAVRPSGTWTLSQAGVTRGSATGDVLGVVDVTRSMRVDSDADTELIQMYFSAGQLGMTVDAIRASIAVLGRSPLRTLVADHVLTLSRLDADALAASARESLGAATVELVRAMLIGAGRPEEQVGSEMSTDRLRTCVEQYVRQHLRDPDLNPAAIAQAHSISLRHLYNVWGSEGETLSRWIVLQRLAAVREGLADPRHAHRSISAVARDWCFPNPTHLSRRFREEYGLTPREWRRFSRTLPGRRTTTRP